MASRLTTSALRSLARPNGPSVLSRSPAALSRCFSLTAANCVKHVFVETDNQPLNEILKSIQEKIIFPAFLPEKQRKLVFDPSKRTFLAQNPVVIEVDDVTHRFTPLNRFTDIPNSKKALNGALVHMKSKEDWANLATLLSGYRTAGIKLKPETLSKIIRRAGQSGRIYDIIECAKQSSQTGVVLNEERYLLQILVDVNNKIISSNWGLEQTKQALAWNQIVLDLIHRPEHASQKLPKLQFVPLVRGLRLFTIASAVKAKQLAGESVESDMALLKDEITLLNTLWEPVLAADKLPVDITQYVPTKDVNNFPSTTPETADGVTDQATRAKKVAPFNPFVLIEITAQNAKAVSLAEELVGGEVQQLTRARDMLDKFTLELIAARKKPEWDWQRTYDTVMGIKPEPVAETATEA